MDNAEFAELCQHFARYLLRVGIVSKVYEGYMQVQGSDPDREVDIVYDPMYRLPVLCMSTLDHEVRGVVTQGTHAVLQVPCYYVHPCMTQQVMTELSPSKENYLKMWWHFHANALSALSLSVE